MGILIGLYFIGYFVLYIMLKNWRDEDGDHNEWGDIIFTIFASFFTWVGVLAVIIIRWEKYFKNKFPDPPSWL